MTKAFVPEIGSKLKLEKDWTFDVHVELRNSQLYKADSRKVKPWGQAGKLYKRTLPAGSTFLIDQIYVRTGAKDYSSVTLLVLDTTDPVLGSLKKKRQPFKAKGAEFLARFWVKLVQFNEAEFIVTDDATRPMRVRAVCGEPITLGRFKNRKNANWWIKFEHGNPDYCFEGNLTGRVQTDKRLPTQDSYFVGQGWVENVEVVKDVQGKVRTYYRYNPPSYLPTLVPESWLVSHECVEKFKVAEAEYNNRTIIRTRHPLHKQLRIPRQKRDRIPLGIPNDKTLLEDIKVAGGLLTISEVKEVEA